MIEILFAVSVIFVAYVVYTVVGGLDKKGGSGEEKAVKKPAATRKKPVAATEKKKAPAPVKPKQATETASKKEEAPAPVASNGLRNPETGDVSALPTNYRFTKRWVKEALVSEGLLDKIYKANELDDKTNEKIKQALTKFKTIKKYHA